MTLKVQSRWIAIATTLVWVAFIFYVATMPRMPQPPMVAERLLEPLAHIGAHAVLTVLIYLSIAGSRQLSGVHRIAVASCAVLLTMGTGVAIEAVQSALPDRAAELSDLAMNGIGSFMGVASVLAVDQLKISRSFVTALAAGGVALVMVLVSAGAFA